MKPSAESRKYSTDEKEGRIVELEAELAKLKQEARAFSYSVSHDLRAPLRAIEGFSRILAEDYSKNLDEEGQKFLQHVLQNAQTMSGLIDGLLQYHRLNERGVNKAAVDMTQLTRDIVAALPKEKQPGVTIPKLPTVQADPALMRIAWEQLVSNALKFSRRAEKAAIEFGSSQQNGETVLWVKDNGIGFDMQYSDKLFHIFQKLQRESDFEGHGVGLALVRRVAEKHHGRVWVDAKPDQGATFYLALPKNG